MDRKDGCVLNEEDIERILELVQKSDFNYLELIANGVKLVVSKTPFQDPGPSSVSSLEKRETQPQKGSYDSRPEAKEAPREKGAEVKVPVKDVPDEGEAYVRSPMIGTFYRAPSPGAPAFVEIGGMVDEGMTVCIIEVMKVMTSVKAGVKGRVREVLAENGELIEYDQPLFLVEV
jgi:acetyl-CoA carboxylase biotin carboxyl carrier protein